MVTNDERRDVARLLRDYSVQDLRYTDPICELVCSTEIDCIGFDSCCGSDTMPECVKLVFDRLADLIEPEPERTCRMEYAGEVPPSVRYSCYFCSECGSPIYNDMEPRYCPYCGAKVVSE